MAPSRLPLPSTSTGHLRDRHSRPAGRDDHENPGIFAHPPDHLIKGVSDDISELTKTFTRQLRGVASFLSGPPHEPFNQTDRHQISAAITFANALHGSGSEMDPPSHSQSLACPVEIKEEVLSIEQIDTHHQASKGGILKASRIPMPDSSESCFCSERRINGVGKDLAELRGSVATGFSRIMKVMREEIDRDQRAHKSDSDSGHEFCPRAYQSESALKSPQRPAVSTVLSNILQEVSGASLNRESSRVMEDGDSTFRLKPCDENSNRGKSIQHGTGITEEVLTFARNISMHPETWLDFPLLSDEEDEVEYEMSVAQKEHVLQVELACPRLAALRIELCPDYMSVGCFWKIYFVLLHPRLTTTDAVLLSTPQIVETRALLLKKLQNRDIQLTRSVSLGSDSLNSRNKLNEKDALDRLKSLPGKMESFKTFKIVSLQGSTKVSSTDFHQIEDLPVAGDDRPPVCADYGEEVQNKNILASTLKLTTVKYDEVEADADKWLEEETSPCVGYSVYCKDDEDVSFSDLEIDDESMAFDFEESSISKRSRQLNKIQTSQELGELRLSKIKEPDGVLHIDPGRKSGAESYLREQVS